MNQVIKDFAEDGVRYLELRTTPRECVDTGMSKEQYVYLVNQIAGEWNKRAKSNIKVFIILSIDRSMSAQQANQVLNLAMKYQHRDGILGGQVVGIDLCGNPCKGKVETFTPIFEQAKKIGLSITVHFAEVPQSATNPELSTILSWSPDRLGHCIHVPESLRTRIQSRGIGLEMCLSCNVLAELTKNGFENHHLKDWLGQNCPIALSTDDVGIFGSPLSNEYLLVARTFGLSKADLIQLSRSALSVAFTGRGWMTKILDVFEKSTMAGDCQHSS